MFELGGFIESAMYDGSMRENPTWYANRSGPRAGSTPVGTTEDDPPLLVETEDSNESVGLALGREIQGSGLKLSEKGPEDMSLVG